jgi:hypothetical protein
MRGFLLSSLEKPRPVFDSLNGVFLGDSGCQAVSVGANGCQSVASIGHPRARCEIQDETPTYDHSQMSSNLSSGPTERSSGRRSARLAPERIKQLAECLIAGRTRNETAEALRVSPRTVSRWKRDPAVIAEVDRLRSRTSETRAEDVLLRLLESDDERIRLMAVRETLRWKIQRAPEEPLPDEAPPPGMRRVFVREEPF